MSPLVTTGWRLKRRRPGPGVQDWNLSSREDGPGMEPYQAAKRLAEEMVGEFAAEVPGVRAVAILPTCLLGPPRSARVRIRLPA